MVKFTDVMIENSNVHERLKSLTLGDIVGSGTDVSFEGRSVHIGFISAKESNGSCDYDAEQRMAQQLYFMGLAYGIEPIPDFTNYSGDVLFGMLEAKLKDAPSEFFCRWTKLHSGEFARIYALMINFEGYVGSALANQEDLTDMQAQSIVNDNLSIIQKQFYGLCEKVTKEICGVSYVEHMKNMQEFQG